MKVAIAHAAESRNRHQRHWLSAALLAAAACAALSVTVTVRPAIAQTVTVVDVVKVAEGFRASKLLGTKVVNSAKEEVGTLDDLIFDQDRLVYAILQVGAFLGLGGYLVAVPYESLEISDGGRGIVLTSGGSKEELQQTQEFKYGQDK
ncbi:PRC-barrel domain-containing protein [Devosia sp. ZB163]|uniref:PRC-barrel domain-containing protein n=1 Tax=Devosia sp. ZB163 TaxID=3025938 RepID=UPI0023617D1F|nr:PRC-barrel domain-containing protein [Devosia sp. ZB163]MDC9822653.1 PRC-barrel domain-containing protein [Devosia sp. ZB163]